MKIDFSLIKLAPADDSHREFSYRVKKEAEGKYIAQTWGWDEDVQRKFHAKDWENTRPELIRYDGKPIGTILVVEDEENIKIRQFFILPEYQNRGIGSYLLKNILDKADWAGRVTRITCLKNNRAVSLYLRHGFEITGEEENFSHMERMPVKSTGWEKPAKYQAIIFDLFGTLIDNLTHSENKAMLIKMALILEIPPEQFLRIWLETSGEQRFTGAFTDLTHTLRVLSEGLNPGISDSQIERAVCLRHDYIKQAIIPRPGTIDALEQLKSKGYKLGLITDCSSETVTIWGSTLLAPFFDAAIFSCSVRMMKPDLRIYHLAAEQLGVVPGKCLYVGDGGSNELTGALKAGMHPVLIRDPREDDSEIYYKRQEWNGPIIKSLLEVPNLI